MSHIIGIDVSKASLDCAYLRDADQKRPKRLTCQNEVCCFAALLAWAEERSGRPVASLAFIIEPTHIYHEQLVQFLHDSGATVYLVNPSRVRKFAEGIGILSKNDLIDADVLVRYGLTAKNLMAWIMIVILGSRPFRSAPEVASFLGLNPIEKRSGNSEYRRPRLSKSGSGHYRQQLYFPAMVATRKNPDVQALYERLLAADKTKMCALGAAMRKLVHICYVVVKNQTPYQAQTV